MSDEKMWERHEFETFGSSTSLCALREAVKRADAALVEGTWRDFELEVEGDDDYASARLTGIRQETDQEYANRLLRERNIAARDEEHERRHLAYLKAKYERGT